MKVSPMENYWSTRCSNQYVVVADGDGTFKKGPAGWQLERLGTGVYEITHNLGTTEYAPVPFTTVGADYKSQAEIQDKSANTVRIGVYVSAQAADQDFALLILTL